jgi:drug/metabolite transporter (DMT)-like permease
MVSVSTTQSAVADSAAPAATAGIGMGALAFGLFSLMDALVKWLSASYPVPQILVCNALFALVPVGAMVVHRGGLPQLHTRRLGLHLVRGVLGTTGGFLAFYAFSRLPLADAYAIIFATPLLITALSVPILGEAVGWRRWSAVLIGFVGVLVMLRPGMAPMSLGSLAALGAACASACAILLVRKLSVTETTTSIAFYSNVTAVVLTGIAFSATFVVPSLLDLALMAASGLIGGTALLVLIAAYRSSPAALVAPFQYSQMLWAILLGALVWGDLPEPLMLLGASIVAGSGLFILYRETALGRRPTASLHPNAAAPPKPTPTVA